MRFDAAAPPPGATPEPPRSAAFEPLSIEEAARRLAFTDLAFWLRRPPLFEEQPDLPDRFRGALGRRLEEFMQGGNEAGADAATLHGLLFGGETAREKARPYVLRIDVRNNEIKAVLRLFGSAANYWAMAESAFAAACEQGVALKQNSKHRLRFEIRMKEHHACAGLPKSAVPVRATLLFRTPLAIRSGQHTKTQLRTMPVNIAARLAKLLAWQGATLEYDRRTLAQITRRLEWDQREMRWLSWMRHSSTTPAGGMSIGGFVGALRVTGDLQPVWPLLRAGAITHAGGETALGLGRYDLLAGV
jgi:hypothetical protein